ncbi:MAG: sensor histidine kinase [Lachnospiraceae bacterium]|nr:sensor histidine kinase [Lachnospiraceae bacterium]
MDWLELMVDIVEGGIHVLFLSMVLSKKEKGISWWLRLVFCILFYAAFSYFIINKYNIVIGEGVIIVARLLMIAFLLCEGGFFKKLTVCMLSDILTTIASLLTAICVPVFLNSTIGNTLQQDGSTVRVFALAFAKACQLTLSISVVILLRRLKMEDEKEIWTPLALMLVFSSSIITLMTSYNRINDSSGKNIIFVVAMILSVIESIIVFFIFLRILHNERENNELSAFIRQIETEVDSVKVNEENLKEIRKLKHEIRNDYVVVRELLGSEKYDEAIKKTKDIINDAEDDLSKVIDLDTGSVSVNAVLNYYVRNLEHIGADVKLIIEKNNMVKKYEKEICSILLNLLKNAYETEIKNEKKGIEILIKNDINYLRISVSNKIDESVLNVNGMLETTKTDKKNHGFGIKSIRKIVDSENGQLRFWEESGWFIAEVWLPGIEKNTD